MQIHDGTASAFLNGKMEADSKDKDIGSPDGLSVRSPLPAFYCGEFIASDPDKPYAVSSAEFSCSGNLSGIFRGGTHGRSRMPWRAAAFIVPEMVCHFKRSYESRSFEFRFIRLHTYYVDCQCASLLRKCFPSRMHEQALSGILCILFWNVGCRGYAVCKKHHSDSNLAFPR